MGSIGSDSTEEQAGALSSSASSYEPIKCSQTQIHADIKQIATYLAEKKVLYELVVSIVLE